MFLPIKTTRPFRQLGILLTAIFPPAAREPAHNNGSGPFAIKRVDANIAGVLSLKRGWGGEVEGSKEELISTKQSDGGLAEKDDDTTACGIGIPFRTSR